MFANTWFKHSCKKIIDPMVHSHVFKVMGDVMYLEKVLHHAHLHIQHIITKKEVSNQLFQLHTTYMSIKLLFDYVDAYWVLKSTCGA